MDLDPLVVVGKSILDGASPQIEQTPDNTAENLIMSVFGNRAARWRLENLMSVSIKCGENLRKRGLTNTEQLRDLLPKFGLLFVEQASLEDNQTLQDVWANLLANALTPQRDFSEFQYDFMDVIRGLSPAGTQLLKFLFKHVEDYRKKHYGAPLPPNEPYLDKSEFFLKNEIGFSMDNIWYPMPISGYDYIIAVQNLLRLHIVKYHDPSIEFKPHLRGKPRMPYEKDICFTFFGYMFVKTCLSEV